MMSSAVTCTVANVNLCPGSGIFKIFTGNKLLCAIIGTGKKNFLKQFLRSFQATKCFYQGSHRIWKVAEKIPCIEKSWNLKVSEKNHGKIMEFCDEVAFWKSVSHKFFSHASLARQF